MNPLHSTKLFLNAARATTSTKEKSRLLSQYADQWLLLVLVMTYDFYRNYYVTTVPLVGGNPGGRPFNMEDWDRWCRMLNEANSRAQPPRVIKEWMEGMSQVLLPGDYEVLAHILRRDLKCGINIKTINATLNNVVPTFELMAAQSLEDPDKLPYPVYVDPKYDGYRAIAIRKNGRYELMSKNGLVFESYTQRIGPRLDQLADILGVNYQFEGEVMSSSYGEVSSARKRDSVNPLRFVIFDCLTDHKVDKTPFNHRRDKMYREVQPAVISNQIPDLDFTPSWLARNSAEFYALFNRCVENGLEGVMAKIVDHTYECRRSPSWLKFKPLKSFDGVVTALNPEKDNPHLLGSFTVEGTTENGNKFKVNVPARGEGHKGLLQKHNEVLGRTMRLDAQEETVNSSTGNISLRFARFNSFRDYQEYA